MTADASESADIAELADRLVAAGQPFATVTVVRREPPVSATVGDRAIVTADGELHGWIGGVACAQSIAVTEGRKAIETGEPALVGIAPDPETVDRPGLESYPMTCHGEGVLELFVEPEVAAPRLVLAGDSPVVETLAELAPTVSLDVAVVTNDTSLDVPHRVAIVDEDAVEATFADAAFVLIASMGAYDERMLELAIAADPPYIGLVASDDRAAIVTERVAERIGIDAAEIRAAIDQPAGINIGAETPPEIAVSILAEVIAVRRTAAVPTPTPEPAQHAGDDVEIDPVCGMEVIRAEAAATDTYGGRTYAFCGPGCADAFADDPERFVDPVEVQ